MRNKITLGFLCIIMSMALYLMVSLFVDVPFPKFFTDFQEKHTKSRMEHDPFMRLAKFTDSLSTSLIEVKQERDSLQHMVDSLTKR